MIHSTQQATTQWVEGRTMLRELLATTTPHIIAIQVHSISEQHTSELLEVIFLSIIFKGI